MRLCRPGRGSEQATGLRANRIPRLQPAPDATTAEYFRRDRRPPLVAGPPTDLSTLHDREDKIMNLFYRPLALTALIANCFVFGANAQPAGYLVTDLVVNRQVGAVPTLVDSYGIRHIAKFVDRNLVNPWGISESGTSPFWISDAGLSTLYNTAGAPQPLVVSIPKPSDVLGTGGATTGTVFNNVPAAQKAFQISGVNSSGDPVTASAVFLFATEDGTILGWNPGVNPQGFDPAKAGRYAIIAVDHSPGASYTGLALATDTGGTTRLYAANLSAGTVDVFDTSFQQVTSDDAFREPRVPSGYGPFNVVPLTVLGKTRMFVMYALQDDDDNAGEGRGFVSSFELDGTDPQMFAQHGQLNAPWGAVLAPQGFGDLGGAIWIGNFGDGRINAYDALTGRFISKVRTPDGLAVIIDGLWSLKFGNGGNGGSLNTLYFTAGPNHEHDGLFGSINPR